MTCIFADSVLQSWDGQIIDTKFLKKKIEYKKPRLTCTSNVVSLFKKH